MAELKWLIKRGNYYYFGDAPVHATGVSLDKSSITLTEAGQTEQLNATVTPSGAVEQGVTWSSSDTSIATVSNMGLVTCITPGDCIITVTTEYGGHTATCSVSEPTPVYQPVWDYYYNSAAYDGYDGTGNTYYGLSITPKINCTLDKIKLVGDTANPGNLIIWNNQWQSTLYSDTLTTANTAGGEFTLTTPFQMTAGYTYNIGIKGTNYYFYKQANGTLTGTNVNFNGAFAGTSMYTNYIFNIRGVETTQTS